MNSCLMLCLSVSANSKQSRKKVVNMNHTVEHTVVIKGMNTIHTGHIIHECKHSLSNTYTHSFSPPTFFN